MRLGLDNGRHNRAQFRIIATFIIGAIMSHAEDVADLVGDDKGGGEALFAVNRVCLFATYCPNGCIALISWMITNWLVVWSKRRKWKEDERQMGNQLHETKMSKSLFNTE